MTLLRHSTSFALLVLVLWGVGARTASAFAPVNVGSATVIVVAQPEFSKMFFGELAGTPATYAIYAEMPFQLYLNILAPDLPDARTDLTVRIDNARGESIAILEASSTPWQRWHEDLTGDAYLKGPLYQAELPAGTYKVTVANPANAGKYVLMIGDLQDIKLDTLPGIFRDIYLLKTDYLGKPWYAMFQGLIGKFLTALIVIILSVLVLVRLVSPSRR